MEVEGLADEDVMETKGSLQEAHRFLEEDQMPAAAFPLQQ